jgi:hypothetical protein
MQEKYGLEKVVAEIQDNMFGPWRSNLKTQFDFPVYANHLKLFYKIANVT